MSSHIRVLVRFRPLTPAEAEAGPRCASPAPAPAASPASAVAFHTPTTTASFAYDGVLGEAATQADAFAAVSDVVDGVLAGRSGSIIAYGAWRGG